MRVFLIHVLLCLSWVGFSQNSSDVSGNSSRNLTKDAGLWLRYSLEFDLPDKYTAGVDFQSRWNENISEARSNFIQPWASKEWSDAFSTTIAYRAIARRNLDNEYEDRDRLSFDLKYKFKIKDLKLQYRFRSQRPIGLLGKQNAADADYVMRHRLKVGYKLSKKWDLAVLGETYFDFEETGVIMSNIRFRSSLQYKVKKRNYLTLGYLIQREYNTNAPLMEFNGMIGYSLIIK